MSQSNLSETSPTFVDSLDAYESVSAEIDAITEAELAPVNVDILISVTTVLGAIPKLRQLRPQLAELKDFDLERFDRLESYARALGHTHSLLLRGAPSPEIAKLAEDAAELRETLLTDAAALARRDLLDKESLSGLKGAVGYRNLAFDLAALSNLLRQAWTKIEGKSAIQASELNRARALGDQLLTAVGLRQHEAPEQSDAGLNRQRAFTVFVRAYNQIRRAVTYLRWEHGDANEFAPSLYERRNLKRKSSDVPAPSAELPSPALPASNGGPPASAAAGLPGDDPFEAR
jgi:hypothetical protein